MAPKPKHEIEVAFVNAFVVRDKRERYRGFLAGKRRSKVLDSLYHWDDYYSGRVVAIPPACQTRADILSKLSELGAPALCYAISNDRDLDARKMSLEEALRDVVGNGEHGTILSCIPGRLAYYEGQDPENRFILHRR